jgi:hypothetical protein
LSEAIGKLISYSPEVPQEAIRGTTIPLEIKVKNIGGAGRLRVGIIAFINGTTTFDLYFQKYPFADSEEIVTYNVDYVMPIATSIEFIELKFLAGHDYKIWDDWSDLIRLTPLSGPVPPITCIETAHEVLEYCPDEVTEKRWRDCIDGKWVTDSRVCPECEETAHEVLEYCPGGVTEKRWRNCVSGVWVEDSQVCPCSPEGAHEVLEYCLDEVTEKRWRDCISGTWLEYFQACPTCIEGERDVIEYCPDGVTWRLWWECIEEEWEHKSQKCPPAEGDRKCINFDLYEYQSGEWVLIEPRSVECLLCPIAVIAQGTELVDALGPIREFRDRYLKSNRVGRKFVSFYYGALTSWLSPLLMRHNQLKRVGRMFIVHPLKKFCEVARKIWLEKSKL